MAILFTSFPRLQLKFGYPASHSASQRRRNAVVLASLLSSPERTARMKWKQLPLQPKDGGGAANSLAAKKVMGFRFMEEVMERARNLDAASVSNVINDMITVGLTCSTPSDEGAILGSEVLMKPPFILMNVGAISWLVSAQVAQASEDVKRNVVYETGELFELGIQLSYLLLLLALLGIGTFVVIRQVLVRRELDLSAKELQEQVRSGDASATGLFELGAVMLRRKFYPAATKYLLQAIEKWDGDDQDLAQVYNALGVSYVRDGKLEKAISQFENAVKLQPGYVTAWNNLGDAYEKKKDLKSALKAFEEVLLFDPNNKVARPRRDDLKEKVQMYKGVPIKSKQR